MNQLKEAEKKATELVQAARKARVERMKEAKSEAEKIIAAYRAEMEASYQSSLSKIKGKSGEASEELQVATSKDIDSMNQEFALKKSAVEKMLVDLVLKVNTTVPKSRSE